MRLPKMIRKNSKESSPILKSSSGSTMSTNHLAIDYNRSNSSTSTSTSTSSSTSVSFLREIQIEEEFEILKILSEGSFSKVYLAKRALGGDRLVLKAINSDLTSIDEFNREVNLTYFLSPHPNTVTCYNVSFIWNNSYVFVQEHAPLGSLKQFVKVFVRIPENKVKLIAGQIASALEFIHDVNLVHRDVTLDNILIYKANLSLVKLSDFGYTRSQGSLVLMTQTQNVNQNSAPPEICDLLPQEKYYCHTSSDVWQLGILIFKCLTGSSSGPWNCADITDPRFRNYTAWLRRKSLKIPEELKPFTTRFLRLFKRILEPKPTNRCRAKEVMKYLKDDWIKAKRLGQFSAANTVGSNHIGDNDPHCNNYIKGLKEGKNLKDFGLNNEIDKKRVEDWILYSTHN